MKTTTLLFVMILATARTFAQSYQISFAGTGASTTVDSVRIENLTQCTDTTIGGSDILQLTGTVGINEIGNSDKSTINIYPNPMAGSCFIDFEVTEMCKTNIELYEISGKRIYQTQELTSKGHHTYSLSGVGNGIFILKVESDIFSYTTKILSTNAAFGNTEMKQLEITPAKQQQSNSSNSGKLKNPGGSKSIIFMQFNPFDTLKLTGKSGIYRTVSMLVPTQNQTVTFTFVACTDADGNSYAVVQIGTQLWMGENLRTTHYRDGSAIPNLPDSASWGSTLAGAYCNYHNDPAEGIKYGFLYNWFAVGDARNIAPVGWHVATNSEWNKMEKFLDNTVDTTGLGGVGKRIGRILKESCNTRWAYIDSTCGSNTAGFTALCQNYRVASGAWSLGANNSHDDAFWTATPAQTGMAWFKSCRYCFRNLFSLYPMKQSGYGVRCVHD